LTPQSILWKSILNSVYTVQKKLQAEPIKSFVATTAEVVITINFMEIEVII